MWVWIVSQLGEFRSFEGEHGVVGFLQDGLSFLDLLLYFLHYLFNLCVFALNLPLFAQDNYLNILAGLFLGLENWHNLQQFLCLVLDLGLHFLDLHLEPLQDLRDLMDLQDAPIEDVFFLLGLLQQFPIIVDKPVDDFKVVEGVVLEMILLVVFVVAHEGHEVVVDLEEEVGEALLVRLLLQVLLEDLVGDLQDGLGWHLFDESVFGVLVGVVIVLHEVGDHLPARVKQELDLLGSHKDEIRNDLVIRLGVLVIVHLLELVYLAVCVLAVLVTQQLLNGVLVAYFL